MSVGKLISERNISRVLHYTTSNGLIGVLATREIKSRSLLTADKYLEHIYKQACHNRERDKAWHGYVNLSISRINARLFNIASDNWHYDLDGFWCVLSFRPEILTHDGVFFTTTNNIYTGVKRGSGADGLSALFADRVVQYGAKYARRSNKTPAHHTTCDQAEVLYPRAVPFEYCSEIFVRDDEHADNVHGMFEACSVNAVPVSSNVGVFLGG